MKDVQCQRNRGARANCCWCLLLGIVIVVLGCQAPTGHSDEHSSHATPRREIRDNAYSLLYDLLSDEQHVSKLLIIKRDRRELHQVIKSISTTAGQGVESLEAFAKRDPALRLKALDLPPGETATRKAIADTKKKRLLGTSGLEFERNLLLTQMEALNYGSHLARVASGQDDNAARVRYLSGLGETFDKLYEQVLQLLFEPSSSRN